MRLSYDKIVTLLTVIVGLAAWPLHAQQKTFNYNFKLQGTASTGDYLPFWLYSNKHGIIDINAPGGQAIFNFQKNLMNHHSGFDYGFGTTVVGRYSKHATAFFNQLYAVFSYGPLQFKGGRFYEQLGDVDPSLSMGSLAISQNATPMPKIKLAIPDYTAIPFTHGYVEFKGEIAHGWFGGGRFIKDPWLHQKSAYVRLGGSLPFRPYLGLTDEVTWAGTAPVKGKLADSFHDFIHVLLAQHASKNIAPGENIYRLGDHRGIWDTGFYLTLGDINLQAYYQKIYNDGDGLELKNADGLWGLDVRFPGKRQHFVTGFLWEYLYTKNQSGPIPPGAGRGGPGGRDNYYNNYLYQSGWTYEGRTIGNPLFLNAYNPRLGVVVMANRNLDTKDPLGIVNNRIVAHHFGLEGHLSETVNYKLLATYSRNYGNYYDGDLYEKNGTKTDFYSHPDQWSFLAKFSYQPSSYSYSSFRLTLSLADDVGQLYDNVFGIMFGIELLGTSSF
jgi:hypothetical protein